MRGSKGQYIEIDDLIIDKNAPFEIYESLPKIDGKITASFVSKRGKQDNLGDFTKYLFEQNIQDCQGIDQMMLHHRSVSSLRDYALFSPPSVNTKSEETQCASKKKTIFINQFTTFEYSLQN